MPRDASPAASGHGPNLLRPRGNRRVSGLRCFPQFVLENFSGRCHGQCLEHYDLTGTFVGSELRGGVLHQFDWFYGGAGQQLNESDYFLVAADRTANDGRLNHQLMRIEHRLHLGRIDVESRADDQRLGAPDNEKVIAIKAAEVASVAVLNQPSASTAFAVKSGAR
jgi:hypothetical protein